MIEVLGNELASIMAISNWHQTISNGSNEKSTSPANCRRVTAAAAAAVATAAVAAAAVGLARLCDCFVCMQRT